MIEATRGGGPHSHSEWENRESEAEMERARERKPGGMQISQYWVRRCFYDE